MLVNDLVRSIVVAWKSLSSYPRQHPAVVSAFAHVTRLMEGHLLGAHSLSLGAARDGLLFGEEKLTFPMAQVLANTLWGRDVAVLTFEEGLEPEELSRFLQALAPSPPGGEGREGRSLGEELAAAGIKHIKVEAVDFSGIRAWNAAGGGGCPDSGRR